MGFSCSGHSNSMINGKLIVLSLGLTIITLKVTPDHRRLTLFWEHEENRAIRDGRCKLVANEKQPWELYGMKADRTKMNNLAARESAVVRELEAK
jgi:arylsulfatase A-like enzyme